MWRTTVKWLVAGSLLALLIAAPASGAELISIPVDEIIYGSEGEEILVASAEVPPDLIGLSCQMTGETVNQESVHFGNDLVIRLGAQTEELANFEDERDIRYTFSSIAELPPRIDVYVRLGPDGVSSGGFLISIECDLEPPTSSTSTSTTISDTSSTTTTISNTSSTSTTTTSTLPGVSSTTSNPPGSTLATTTLAPSSTTIQVAGPSTTSLPPGGTTSVTTPNQLAVTGTEAIALTWLGLTLAALGALALGQAGRLRSEH